MRVNVKHLATKEMPTEQGWYLWWDNPKDSKPFHVLAMVKIRAGEVLVNLEWDKSPFTFIPIESVAPRLWLKVSDD